MRSTPPSLRVTAVLIVSAWLAGCPGGEAGSGDDGDGPRAAPSGEAGAQATKEPRGDGGADRLMDLPDFGLGARIEEATQRVTFRVRSESATRLVLDLFAKPRGEKERLRVPLEKLGAGLWGAAVPLATLRDAGIETIYYGFRAWGPNWPYVATWTSGSLEGFVADMDAAGHRFNPNKLLYDPYALELTHDPFSPEPFDGSVYELGPGNREKDSALVAPKGIVVAADGAALGEKPERPLTDDVVYEVHVRGLTMRDESVPEALRGTYLGAARKAKYLRELGVTAIEVLPIHETQNEQNDTQPARQNYWGYLSHSFFAPDRRFASDKSPGGPTRELREMVRAFHAEGIKVFVDVVYNHTGEGGSNHLFSWRGFGAETYYERGPTAGTFADNNGVGPNFHPKNPIARQLIVDSLAYYAHYIGVDGFRFDLASVLGDSCDSYCFIFDKLDPKNALNRAAKELPARSEEGGPGVDLIAEPWAIGLGTYQVGGFPSGWSEWNDHFRDTIRTAQNRAGVADVSPRTLAEQLMGSPSIFADDGRKPAASVNFLAAHDGFTLRDVYSYDSKQNLQPPPFGPSDGGNDNNLSWNQGGVATEQQKAARTAMVLLATAAGVPMILGGDELYRTQRGNNNAYNLDNEANWLDWTQLSSEAKFHAFVRGLFALRAAHPALRPRAYRDGTDHDGNGLPDFALLMHDGRKAEGSFLDDGTQRFVAMRIDGEEAGDSARSIFVAYNWSSHPVAVALPPTGPGKSFRLAAHSDLGFVAPVGGETPVATSSVLLAARSAIVLVER